MNIELRKDCPMRHKNGNCLPAGGFCTAVNNLICEALHNAYYTGRCDADVVEVKHGRWITHKDDADCEYIRCSECGEEFYPPDNAWSFDVTPKYCQECGTKMDNKRE